MELDPNADRYFKGILGKTGDNTYQVPRIDASTGALIRISYVHHEIHGGSSFTTYYTRTTTADTAYRSGIYLLTPTDKEVHMVASFSASTAATYSICEGVTIDANEGTASIIYNRDRNSAKTSLVRDNATTPALNYVTTWTEVQLAAANFSAGTVLRTEPLQVGSGPKPAGGVSRGTEEYILKKNTKYFFRITNTAASANTHHILLDWYEHTRRTP